jgi:hypothetical protein
MRSTIVVVVSLSLNGGSGNSDGPSTESPTAAPTLSEKEELRQFLHTVSGPELLLQESTPQRQAYLWVLEQQQAQADEEDHLSPNQLLERYILAVLYWAMGGPNWTQSEGFLSDLPVCEWGGVTCGIEKTVVNLHLGT